MKKSSWNRVLQAMDRTIGRETAVMIVVVILVILAVEIWPPPNDHKNKETDSNYQSRAYSAPVYVSEHDRLVNRYENQNNMSIPRSGAEILARQHEQAPENIQRLGYTKEKAEQILNHADDLAAHGPDGHGW